MKRMIVFILIGLVSVSAGVLDSSKVVMPHAGSQALEFGYSGVLSLGSYMGNTIALKKHSSPLRATRYALNITSDGYDHTGIRHEFSYDPFPADSTIDSAAYDYTSKSSSQDFFLSIQWIKYHRPYGQLSLLYGAGPLFGINHSTRENAMDPRGRESTSNWQDDRDVTTSVYLGLTPVVGVEWFLHRNISFHAEYYSLLKVGWRVITDDYTWESSNGDWDKRDSELSGVYYSARGYARGGVSFYFK